MITAVLLPDCSLGQDSRDHSDAFPIFLGGAQEAGLWESCLPSAAGGDRPAKLSRGQWAPVHQE